MRQTLFREPQAPTAAAFYPAVTRIDISYTLGDGTSMPYFCLSLDTRPGSEPDGDSTHPLFDIIDKPDWGVAIRYLLETNGNRMPFILTNGQRAECDASQLQDVIGKLFVEELKAARDQQVFLKMPRVEQCELGVEELGGDFGWPNYDDRGQENLV